MLFVIGDEVTVYFHNEGWIRGVVYNVRPGTFIFDVLFPDNDKANELHYIMDHVLPIDITPGEVSVYLPIDHSYQGCTSWTGLEVFLEYITRMDPTYDRPQHK